METTQIPEVREPQRDHILCFHFSAPSILSGLLCLLPRCANHPKRLGCVRMFQLARCLLHQYKWLNCFLINQRIDRRGHHETRSVWQRKSCWWVVLGNHVKVEVCRSCSSSSDIREQLHTGEGPASVYQTVSAVFLHLPSLPVQWQIGSTPGVACSCLQPRCSHSDKPGGPSFCRELNVLAWQPLGNLWTCM